MWQLLLASLLALGGVEVKITPLSGPAVTGTLTQLSAEQIAVATPAGERQFGLKNIVSVAIVEEKTQPAVRAEIHVTLLDGSILLAKSYAVVQGNASIQLIGGLKIETRTRSIRSVRLKLPAEAVEAAWQEIQDATASGDVIVVRKMSRPTEADEKPAIVLDRLEGVIQDISDDTVKFQFDGDTIEVRREKLEGMIYFSPVARELPTPICRFTDKNGSLWNAKSIRLDGELIALETPVGVVASVPVAGLRKLDYSVGNTTYLSDLEPDSVEWSPFFDSPALRAQSEKQFLPRRDTAFDGGRLMLGQQSYDKGLAIHSRTKLVYRVPKESKDFLATVGIDSRIGENGNVKLVISDGDRILFDKSIAGKDPPIEIALDLAGVRRLTILVDFGDEIDIGDHLNLCNARITK